jgi:cell wall-associated NlpC family hydrolase
LTEAKERAAVIAEAYSWLKTPFSNGSRIKGAGVDCAMLIECVFIKVGLLVEEYKGRYSSQWHLHRDEERYLAWAKHLAVEIEKPQPGDVGLWQFGRCYSHGALFVDAEHVIHAYQAHGMVTKDPVRMGRLSMMKGPKGMVPRPVKYFDLWAKRRGV